MKLLFFFKNKDDTNDSVPICNDIDECKLLPFVCQVNQNCFNTNGSYSCACKLGYTFISSNNSCVDINECDQSPCSANATCANTDGSYNCTCKQYYVNVNGTNGTCLFQPKSNNLVFKVISQLFLNIYFILKP